MGKNTMKYVRQIFTKQKLDGSVVTKTIAGDPSS